MRGRSIILTRASASKYKGPAGPFVVLSLNDQTPPFEGGFEPALTQHGEDASKMAKFADLNQ
jgi:hypothetical protein